MSNERAKNANVSDFLAQFSKLARQGQGCDWWFGRQGSADSSLAL
jgi:hypothetical protein